MCIFTQPVLAVNNTQIFARVTAQGTQVLAYQMNYESPDENAMILPVPVRKPVRDDSLRFIDLHDYTAFFDDLASGFPFHTPPSIGCSASLDPAAAQQTLEVFNVGNYIASFVPGLRDFDRLDPRFNLPQSVWAKIPQYADYGFAVFQLAAGSLKPHPMAFEFHTEHESIYFPTLHIHDGEVHEREDFDHVLYMQHAGFDSAVYSYRNAHITDPSTGLIRSKYQANRFCDVDRTAGLVDGNLLIHRQIIRGQLPNGDTVIATFGHPTKTKLNFKPFLSYIPWAVFLVAIGWFFGRRSKIRTMKESQQAVPVGDVAG